MPPTRPAVQTQSNEWRCVLLCAFLPLLCRIAVSTYLDGIPLVHHQGVTTRPSEAAVWTSLVIGGPHYRGMVRQLQIIQAALTPAQIAHQARQVLETANRCSWELGWRSPELDAAAKRVWAGDPDAPHRGSGKVEKNEDEEKKQQVPRRGEIRVQSRLGSPSRPKGELFARTCVPSPQ